jgi:PHD/YefM family antitoxin component YafN of YafNO toxin-antitoxin module
MLEATVRDNQELSQLIQQATSKREAITLVQEGKHKAVLLSLEMFQNLIGISDRREQLSIEKFADISRQIFSTSGYESSEKIMQLLHEVKQELSVERSQRLNGEDINA